MNKQLTTRARLVLSFGIVLGLMLLVAGIAIWQLASVAEATRNLTETPLTKERLITDWHSNINAAVNRTTAIAKSNDPSLMAYFETISEQSAKHSKELQEEIGKLLASDEEKKLFAEILKSSAVYASSSKEIYEHRTEGRLFQARQVFEQQYLPGSRKYLSQVQELVNLQRKQINAIAAQIQSTYTTGRALLLGLSVLAVLCALGAAGVFARKLLRQLGGEPSYAASVVDRIAAGDLSTEVKLGSDDQNSLLYSMKNMRDSLAKIVAEVRSGTDTIAFASTEIASGNVNLSSRTESQVSSLAETAASMEELTATVKQNADNALQAKNLALSASDVAGKGGSVVSEVVTTMGAINESARKIVDIISVIDGIAFQTNILALNAAVEAARAGENGRGFAVVASEVRTLAQRSAAAAKEIKALIDNSVEKVEAGSKLVDLAGVTMTDVVASVKRVSDIVAEISHASQEQTTGIEQVKQTINEMDSTTQQNATLVEEAAAASESLQDQAKKLAQLVSMFKLSELQTSHVLSMAKHTPLPLRPASSSKPVQNRPVKRAAPAAAELRSRKPVPVPPPSSGDDWEEF